MQYIRDTGREMRGTLAIWTYIPVLALLALAWVLGLTTDIRAADLLQDVSTTAGVPWYTGSLSAYGVLLWCASAAVSGFAGFLLVRRGNQSGDARFLLAGAMLTTYLLADDLFLLHEEVFSDYLPLSEQVVVGINALIVVGFLLAFRRYLLLPVGGVLLVAVGFLALSTVVDILLDLEYVWIANASIRYITEDGVKLIGIATWFLAFSRLSLSSVESLIPPEPIAVGQPGGPRPPR